MERQIDKLGDAGLTNGRFKVIACLTCHKTSFQFFDVIQRKNGLHRVRNAGCVLVSCAVKHKPSQLSPSAAVDWYSVRSRQLVAVAIVSLTSISTYLKINVCVSVNAHTHAQKRTQSLFQSPFLTGMHTPKNRNLLQCLMKYIYIRLTLVCVCVCAHAGPSRGWFQRSKVLQIQACLRMVMEWASRSGLGHLADKFFTKLNSTVSILATPPQQLTQVTHTHNFIQVCQLALIWWQYLKINRKCIKHNVLKLVLSLISTQTMEAISYKVLLSGCLILQSVTGKL